ncbi:hypothetical protein V6N12_065359 [Hibiscus sabdariffa]|uniref:Uncharacterized protein n=1 Tax=Hibiscus sabdariffa TaxID=183260 RepID=A0ABR2G8G7_9ROSI
MSEGSPVGAYVIKMMGYIQTLEKLGFPLKDELVTDVILQSLSDSFKPFVLNFNMNEINKTLPQLLGMLRTAESGMKKSGSKSILMVRKDKGKGKKKAKSEDTGKGTALSTLKKSRRQKQTAHLLRGHALETTAFTLNRVPSKSVQKTSYEIWTRKCPNLDDYQSNPGESHRVAVKIILKYLRRTKDTFLVYGGEEELSIKGYTDASFQTNKDNLRSQSGFVFCLNGDAVSRKSSKQNTIADSTIEADYIAASEAAKVVVWTKKFINELRVISSISDAVELRCDKNATIAQAKEPISHQRSKHTLRRFHLI